MFMYSINFATDNKSLLSAVMNGHILLSKYSMSPQDISPDTRPAILHCGGDMLRLQVDNSGHWGARVRHNSLLPVLSLLLYCSLWEC